MLLYHILITNHIITGITSLLTIYVRFILLKELPVVTQFHVRTLWTLIIPMTETGNMMSMTLELKTHFKV